MNEVVRRQLAKTISRKESQIRRYLREEEDLRRDAAEVARKRGALQAEVTELESHLKSIGGRVEEEAK